MKAMRAFHGSVAIKEKYVARVKAHAEADKIVKGKYWENGKGCAVGCTIEGTEHSRYETELGIPAAIAHVEDYLFETMPNEDAVKFPLRLLEAIPVGADLSLVSVNLIVYMLEDVLNIKEVQEDEAVGTAIRGVIDLWKRVQVGDEPDAAAESAAESAAWSATWSAAWSATWSATRSATRSVAWSATRSVAWSAARSAARSAAWSVAWSATWSAGESAAKRYGDVLIRFLSEAPVPDVKIGPLRHPFEGRARLANGREDFIQGD